MSIDRTRPTAFLKSPTRQKIWFGHLGILGVELNFDLLKEFPDVRFTSGVIVAAKTSDAADREVPLQTGDVIHALNATPITDLAGLRSSLAALKTGDAVVLQIERYGQLIYVSFVL